MIASKSHSFDLVIRGGTVADGTGSTLWDGDIAIRGDTIVATGSFSGTGREEIDARDKLVTPGFVDIHTHYDAQATWDTRFTPSTNHGVTSILMGNCGVGFAPCKPEMRAAMIDVMEGVEDIPGIVMQEGLPWNWETFPQFMDALAMRHMDADFAVAIPHIPVRVDVMGQRAIDREPSTFDDMDAMAHIVQEGMTAGAFGFSTTRVIGHRTGSGAQLPVTSASEQELMAIALAMKPFGKHLFMSASEFDTRQGFSSEFEMLARIAQTSGHTVTFPLLQYNEAPNRWREIASACAAQRARGADILGQVVARPVGVLLGLQLTLHPFRGCPSYDAVDHLPLARRVKAMQEPELKARILDELAAARDRQEWPDFMYDVEQMFAIDVDPDYAPHKTYRFDRIAKRRSTSAADIAYDTMLERKGQGILYLPLRNYTHGNLDVVRDMLKREETVLGLGDGGAHVGAICDASMQTYMLAYWTRDRARDRLSIPEVVRMMTRDTAQVAGLGDRGLILPRFKADLNIIDHDRLALSAPQVHHDLPSAGRRLSQQAHGYDATIVSGIVTARDDRPTGARPGRLLRHRRTVHAPSPRPHPNER